MDVRNEIKSIIAKKALTLKQVCEILESNKNAIDLLQNIKNKITLLDYWTDKDSYYTK